MIHKEKHPLAGKTVKLNPIGKVGMLGQFDYKENLVFVVEDWWDRVAGKSWMDCDGNPAAMNYGMRSGLAGIPIDNEVVYGKVGVFGHLIHVSELGEVVETTKTGAN